VTDGTRRLRPLAWLGCILLAVACSAVVGWMALAIYFDLAPAGSTSIRSGLALLVPLAALVALVLARRRWWVVVGIAVAFVALLMAWLAIPPSHARDWQPDVAALPYAEVRGEHLIVHNVRNVDYRTETDYTVRLEDRDLDLTKLRSLDLFLIYWGSPLIAHTILSWGFADGQYLAISIETRKEKGESYSALRGFFRQYELFYVVADERDVIRLRTNYRGEDIYLYRMDVSPANAQRLLLSYFRAINRLRFQPEWYNALTENCTTAIHRIAGPYQQRSWWSWKLFLNGRLDELAYDNGAIDHSLPFAELKAKSYINPRAKAADADPKFSARIREGLPRMSP
jgi:Domain of unknown function (DUF4105)